MKYFSVSSDVKHFCPCVCTPI